LRSDDELVRRFRRGDAGAFRELHARYADRAFFYALALARDEHVAEESVQEAFLGFVRNVRGRAAEGSFRGYLFSSIRNRVIDACRRQGTRREVPRTESLDLFESRDGTSASSTALRGELGERVSEALGALPAEQREVVVLKIFDGRTYREIAELVGESENTVASRYRYACEKLESRLRRFVRNG
jgi:RNA polymerase sigma-70 factor (ECF subfamily)